MRRVFPIAIVLAAGIGLVAWLAWPWLAGIYVAGLGGVDSASSSSTAQPAADDEVLERDAVLALGTLEPEHGVIQVSSRMVGTQIQAVKVQEGDAVETDQLLIQLDPATATAQRDLVAEQLEDARRQQQAEIAGARDKVGAAELALRQLEEGRPLEVEAQQAAIEVASSKAKQAEQELKRITELRQLPEPLVSEPQVEQQRLLLEAARAEVRAAEIGLRRLEQSLDFQANKAQAELRAAQQSLALAEKGIGLASLQRQLDIAELQLNETKILAPTAAVVLTVAAHPGEIVAQQPLLQLGDLDQLVCEAEVDAADAPQIRVGQAAHVRSRAFSPVVLKGTVQRVGNLVAAARLRPLDPRQPLDRSVVKVVIDIPPDQVQQLVESFPAQRRSALVGLQVEIELPLP